MVLSVRRLLTAALDRVGRDERAAAMLSAALENVGAQTLADRIDRRRSGGGIEPIVLPAGPNAFRRRRIKMFGLNGNDQIVRAVRNGGWRAFECPLPDVYCLFARLSTGQVYDVGANTGFYSLVAVTANHGVTVHAFEPARDVFPLLESNVGLCPHRAHITMTATAVSDKVGEAEFFVPLSSGVVETSSSLEGGFKESHLETYRVPVTTLDDYWRHGGRQPVSMIKIDVEGHELSALRGAGQLVDACRPVLVVEVLERAPLEELDNFRRAHDLVDVRISPTEFVIGDPVCWDPAAWNHLFLPRERLDGELAELAAIGVRMTRVG
jgi:FkbM family methyltransferase